MEKEENKENSPHTEENKYYDWQCGYYLKGLPKSKVKITKRNYKENLTNMNNPNESTVYDEDCYKDCCKQGCLAHWENHCDHCLKTWAKKHPNKERCEECSLSSELCNKIGEVVPLRDGIVLKELRDLIEDEVDESFQRGIKGALNGIRDDFANEKEEMYENGKKDAKRIIIRTLLEHGYSKDFARAINDIKL